MTKTYVSGGNNRRPTIVRSSNQNSNFGDDGDLSQNEIVQLEKRLRDAKMPPETEKIIMSELKEMQRMPNFHPNYSMLRNYLELIAELPWSIETTDSLDVSKAKYIDTAVLVVLLTVAVLVVVSVLVVVVVIVVVAVLVVLVVVAVLVVIIVVVAIVVLEVAMVLLVVVVVVVVL